MEAASPALRALMMGIEEPEQNESAPDTSKEDTSKEEPKPESPSEAEEARKRMLGGASSEAEEARKRMLGGASSEAEEARKRMLGGAPSEAEEARKRMLGGAPSEAEEARKRMLGGAPSEAEEARRRMLGGAPSEAEEARKRMLGGAPSEAEEARRRMLGPPAKSGQIVRPPAHMKPADTTVPKKPSIPLQSIYEGQKKTIAESAMEIASSEAAPTMNKAGPPGMSKAPSPAMTKASAPEKTTDSAGEGGTGAPMMSASVAIIDTTVRKKIPVIPILAAAKRKKEQELKAGIKSETHDLDPELLLTQAIQTGTPAAMALLEAMDEMESEVPLKKLKPAPWDLPEQPAPGAIGQQSAMVPFGAAGGGGGMPGMPPGMTPGMMTPGHPEFDPQQLFKAAEMLQMQAAWWETAATIADNLPQGMMTFGIGPTGTDVQYPPNCGRRMSDGKMDDGLPIIATQRIYTGVVKWFDAKKKAGFIECDELLQQGNEHIYCYQDSLHQGRAGISDVVSFPLHTNAKGKLQASTPLIRLATNNGLAQTGVFHPVEAKGGQVMGGEIHCNIIKRCFGCYVKVSKQLAEGLQFGRKVGFNFMVDAAGRCYAYAAKTVADDYIPKMGDLTDENAASIW